MLTQIVEQAVAGICKESIQDERTNEYLEEKRRRQERIRNRQMLEEVIEEVSESALIDIIESGLSHEV